MYRPSSIQTPQERMLAISIPHGQQTLMEVEEVC